MKKLLILVLLAIMLFGCGKSEKNPAKLERTFECTNGMTIEFKKDGTATFSSSSFGVEVGTYKKDGETAYRISFSDGSGGYVKVDGDEGGMVADSTKTAKEVDALEVSEVDVSCKVNK